MKCTSLRARLTLLNLVVLAVAMGAFGASLTLITHRRSMAALDSDLMRRAQGTARAPLPPEMRGPPPGMGRREPPGFDPDDPLARYRFALFLASDGTVIRPRRGEAPFDRASLQAAFGGKPTYATVAAEGHRVRVLSYPWRPPDGTLGAVQVARDLRDLDQFLRDGIAVLAILIPLALLFGGLAARYLAVRALAPMGAVAEAAGAITEHDLSQRLPVHGGDELAELTTTMNGMIDRLESSFASLREAYEAQRRFTADASHELRTPLTRLRMATSEALGGQADPAALEAALRIADKAGRDLSTLAEHLLMLSRADVGALTLDRRPTDLRVVAADALDDLPPAWARRVDVRLPDEAVIAELDTDHVRRVALNLLSNALRHTPEGRAIELSVRDRGEDAELEVRDEGEGVAAEHLPRLGERFYRIDSARAREDGGAGLGLAICKSIVVAHGGSLQIESVLGRGTTVSARFPKPPAG